MKLFNIFKKAGLAAVFLLSAHVAQAGLPPPGYFSFDAEVVSGDYAGTLGFGEVYYDPGALTSGSVRLDPTSGLIDFYFTILGQPFLSLMKPATWHLQQSTFLTSCQRI